MDTDEEATHYLGIAALKKQSSWLSLRAPQVYGSEYGDSDEDDDDYDAGSQVPALSRKSSRASRALSQSKRTKKFTFPAPPSMTFSIEPPTRQIVEPPPRRRNRRRTASSECIVLDVLEEIDMVCRRASMERKALAVPAPQPFTLLTVDLVGEKLWDSADDASGDGVPWDQMFKF